MLILQYHGKSLLSKIIIKFRPAFTPPHSHTSCTPAVIESGFIVGDISEYESWYKGGVCHRDYIGQAHSEGTRVDVYELRTPLTTEEEAKVIEFLESQEGQGYDWLGVICFGIRRDKQHPDKWFCIELVLAGLQCAGRRLFGHLLPHQVHPAMTAASPEVGYRGYIVIGAHGGGYKLHQPVDNNLLAYTIQ
jgi:hypothetical protein